MIEWIQGNEDNLEGKVLVYSKLCNKESKHDGAYFGFFGSLDLDYLFSKFGLKKETMSKVPSKYIKGKKKSDKKSEFLFLYYIPLQATTKDFLQQHIADTDDVISIGKFSHITFCQQSAETFASLYMINLYSQLLQKGINEHFRYIDVKEAGNGKKEKTYADFKGKSIEEYLKDHHLDPMISAKERKEASELARLSKGLIQFFPPGNTPGSRLIRDDVLSLCDIFKKMDPVPGDLTEAYILKIDALHTENYEEIINLNSRIKELRGRYRL